MLYLFLANGFETIEALAPIDILRRADIAVKTVSIADKTVTSAHQVSVIADLIGSEIELTDLDGIILPGGSLGTKKLEESPLVVEWLAYCMEHHLLIGAICAAPSILGKLGYLLNKEATAFPTFQQYLPNVSDTFVVTDDNIITARGAGVSIQFGLEIVTYFKGQEKADEIRKSIQWDNC